MNVASAYRPTVKIPTDAGNLEGRPVDFQPVRAGIKDWVTGLMHVFTSEETFHVGAYYIPPDGRESAVYWFNQAELNAALE